ncbi:GNAT family N-acetyltransferase [Pseudalkalibacillus hwajinpoensis]|uniref:GNAT family N-acetyltransferase n=1 Tax=Guptibacillus hwajinpoensis TaxID=208199 RepID=A0A4U1MEP8_9BACL|nr:GNAT family N-acetyltransferase [Pseudalkalibacillus hwajinpoensis]TKD68812.1 GNAT family N-acetyltransferase [Pseudalkalibacillus hwajinpoensis]
MIIEETENYPFELLLEADPSIYKIKEYVEKGKCFIAVDKEVLQGVYILVAHTPNKAEITNIAVIEEERGRGLGKKLIQDALQRAKKLGMTSVEIGTGNSSIAQLALYQKCGFRICGIIQGFFDDYPEPIVEDGIRCRDMIRLTYQIS